jgi:short-subunit dehydrogenase
MITTLITGARRGIGLDVAHRLAARGHTVYATVRREESVAPTREALRAHGDRVRVEKLDILDPADRARATAWDVDVLINNAALSESGPLLEMDVDAVRRVFETNLHATLELTQAVVRGMIARNRRGARVILMGSVMGAIPTPYRAPYGMSKWALEDLAYSLRGELKPFGIAVVQINPGAYATGFNRESAERGRARMTPDSLYRPHEAEMRKPEETVQRLEVGDTASIAKQIVRAVEARRPRKRYVAPWWQWQLAPFLRALG